ncbi:class I adenylate-forming enzyme family protein [Pseudorhodoferax sp.]|uniref:class I adenylate-forming enzyme family protein n=1 Tax=Pseudorhodoferax sp. TaxID=1993553 RepID=UPI002DD61DA6|nr:AMP-binding protein [Pseudorhodoferax sp.]
MNIMGLLARSARAHPQRPALLQGAVLLADYGTLMRRVQQRATWLRERGLVPGDRVALCMANSPRYLELLYAALWAGLVVVPVNAKLHEREVDYIVAHSGAKLVLSDRADRLQAPVGVASLDVAVLPACDGLALLPLAATDAGDLAWLFYTSGTTGRPKGAMLSHRNLLTMTLTYQGDVEHVEAGDAVVYAAPLSHGAGLYTFAYLSAGARHVVPASGGFDAAELYELGRSVGRLCLFAAPTMVQRLVDEGLHRQAGADGFKTIVYGGGPMYVADLQRALQVMGPRFVQIYGQGETPMTITHLPRQVIADESHPCWLDRLASVGVPHAAVEVRVADEHGRDRPAGQVGEVLVRGDTVMSGYWRDAQASASALLDGWLHTGDLGSFDEAGFLTLKDRSKDVIISGGSNIYPREVEEVLLRHEGVAEVAVIGVPDAEWGEAVIAFVVTRGAPVPDAELDQLCLAHIARFKRPRHYVHVEALPKNNNGKVLKTTLRERAAASLPTVHCTAEQQET